MTHLLVRHKVEDYDRWRAVFDEHQSTATSMGMNNGKVFRDQITPIV
jgi:hypothetical protein